MYKRDQSLQSYQRKAKNFQRLYTLYSRITGLFHPVKGKKFLMETPMGKAVTLQYNVDTNKKTPLYIDLHGGGFVLGSAAMDDAINQKISSELDIKVISIQYVKAPDHPFPRALDQIEFIIRELITRSDSLGIDTEHIAVGGHSAGGNLAAALALRAKEKGENTFSCQILDYPPLDMATSPYDKPSPRGAIPPKIAMAFDASYRKDDESMNPHVSPVYASRDMLTGLPPALIIAAGIDSLHDEAVTYGEKLKEAGVSVRLHDFPNARHGFTIIKSPDTDRAVEYMIAFLKEHI